MRKISQAQPKAELTAVRIETHDVSKGLEMRGLAVGSEAHHLVFVAKFQKAQILRDRAVIKPQRMRKRDRTFNFQLIAAARAPHRTRKIAQAVRGEQRSVVERRNKIAAGQMRLVMLHLVKAGV